MWKINYYQLGLVFLLFSISMDITPVLSALTIGGGNIVQLSFVVVLGMFFFILNNKLRVPCQPITVLFFLIAMSELLIASISGSAINTPLKITSVLFLWICFYSSRFEFRDFANAFVKLADFLILINLFGLCLAIVSFETFSHSPTIFHDESIFRKIDYLGDVKVKSILFTNFVRFQELDSLIKFGGNYLYTGFSAEPHAFFSFSMVAVMFRLWLKGRDKKNITWLVIYFVCMLPAVSLANIIPFIIVLLLNFYLNLFRTIQMKVFFGVVLVAFVILAIFGISDLNFGNNIDYDRSATQTFSTISRLFTFSLEVGLLTEGPQFSNDFDVPNVFFINLFLFWGLYLLIFSKIIYGLMFQRTKDDMYVYLTLLYLFVYSFKNISASPYIPYIMLAYLFFSEYKNNFK